MNFVACQRFPTSLRMRMDYKIKEMDRGFACVIVFQFYKHPFDSANRTKIKLGKPSLNVCIDVERAILDLSL